MLTLAQPGAEQTCIQLAFDRVDIGYTIRGNEKSVGEDSNTVDASDSDDETLSNMKKKVESVTAARATTVPALRKVTTLVLSTSMSKEIATRRVLMLKRAVRYGGIHNCD